MWKATTLTEQAAFGKQNQSVNAQAYCCRQNLTDIRMSWLQGMVQPRQLTSTSLTGVLIAFDDGNKEGRVVTGRGPEMTHLEELLLQLLALLHLSLLLLHSLLPRLLLHQRLQPCDRHVIKCTL